VRRCQYDRLHIAHVHCPECGSDAGSLLESEHAEMLALLRRLITHCRERSDKQDDSDLYKLQEDAEELLARLDAAGKDRDA
jgi:hypothetical protein